MKPVLVVNSGSSSLKYQLIDVDTEHSLTSGLIERVTDHAATFAEMLQNLDGPAPIAVGHRVVHGGSKFSQPTLIDDSVIAAIEELSALAPLHNPGNLAGIRAAMAAFAGVPQIAVFDTAFHQTMPASSYRYAIDAELEARYGIRRYGFHGTSHSFVTRKAAEFLGKPLDQFNAVILHLGNGASACAVKNGKSFDTSMGLTPLQGLVMGTRSGDIDPAIVSYLARVAGLSIQEVDDSLNKNAGLKGMTGLNDLRDVIAAAESGEQQAIEALDVYVQRIKHYVGAYIAEIGPIDALVFTAGVGENAKLIRSRVVTGLEHLGIELDALANDAGAHDAAGRAAWRISPESAQVAVLVVATNEELEIALQSAKLVWRGLGF